MSNIVVKNQHDGSSRNFEPKRGAGPRYQMLGELVNAEKRILCQNKKKHRTGG